jgi:hypothetical protein
MLRVGSGGWGQMAEKSDESPVGKYLGAPIGAALTALLTWATAGSTALTPVLVSLLAVVGGVCGLTLTLVYGRYLGILGADRRKPTERQAYDALRDGLAGGNLAARLYSRWLTASLKRVDRFFGDAEISDLTLLHRAFGLRTPVPLWTAPALDRCLLLALIYPITTIFLIWAVSGYVGPAEAALDLKPDISGWRRGLAVVALVAFAFLWRHTVRTIERKAPSWIAARTAAPALVNAVVILIGVVTAVGVVTLIGIIVAGAGVVAFAALILVFNVIALPLSACKSLALALW